MEGTKELRATVISLHMAGKKPMEIFRDIAKGVAVRVNRILKYDLKVKAYSRRKVHFLNDRLRKLRRERCPVLLKRQDAKKILFTDEKIFTVEEKFHRQNNKLQHEMSGVPIIGECDGMVGVSYEGVTPLHLPTRREGESKKLSKQDAKKILFTDEKIFTVEEKFHRQNNKVYAKSSKDVPASARNVWRTHHPASVMVWWGVSYEGVTPLHFCQQGVKQDSAPAHKAKTTQAWLRENLPDFIAVEEWPPSSPDLNPLDYSLWTELELRACQKSHPNLDSLKRALIREAKQSPLEKIRAAIEDWRERLRACIKNRGGHFDDDVNYVHDDVDDVEDDKDDDDDDVDKDLYDDDTTDVDVDNNADDDDDDDVDNDLDDDVDVNDVDDYNDDVNDDDDKINVDDYNDDDDDDVDDVNHVDDDIDDVVDDNE
ncbi:hypothetical protein MSG28_000408 [Choristoneura fumiferana]|uniref:Uncharacterized protein n=1 Tax=Choristoneura fumiferana TaxID=7141 RepID=A0ACC0K0I4_CHOFU|nr:hypothetical protein MSG28_000408 [Choristoneura fumiferana]